MNIKQNLDNKIIYATIKGLTRPQRNDVSEYFDHKINNLNRNIGLKRPEVYDFSAYELLQEEVQFRL